MTKKTSASPFIISIASTLWSAASLAAECPVIAVPNQFKAEEKVFSIGTDFDLKSGDSSVGKVVERVLNLTTTFEVQNSSGGVVSKGASKFFALGATVDFFDCNGVKIGTLKEKVFESLFRPMTNYSILDAAGKEIATSEKIEFFDTDFTLKDKAGNVVAKIERPWFNLLGDSWSIDVVKPGAIDSRIIPMIPAFKTAADKARRARESSSSSSLYVKGPDMRQALEPSIGARATDAKSKDRVEEVLPKSLKIQESGALRGI